MLKTHKRIVSQLEFIENEELKAAIAKSEQQFAQGAYKTLEEATALAEVQRIVI